MRSSLNKIHLLQVDRGQGGEQRERSSWGERWLDCHSHGGSGAFQAKSCRRKKIHFLFRKCGVRSAVSLGTETRSHGLRWLKNGTVLKWQEERKITSAIVEDWSFENSQLADMPRARFGHWPTTSCPCSAFQDGLGLLAHFTRDFWRWPAKIDSTSYIVHFHVTEVQWLAL